MKEIRNRFTSSMKTDNCSLSLMHKLGILALEVKRLIKLNKHCSHHINTLYTCCHLTGNVFLHNFHSSMFQLISMEKKKEEKIPYQTWTHFNLNFWSS